jgi:serine/threonine protein kinase
MGFRDAAPDGRKDREGHPILVLTQGTLLAGKYQVVYLGVGGMSIVYKGYREGTTCFIKEVESWNSQHVYSLLQEKLMLESLEHPGIVKLHDFFEEGGFFYLVTDFIEGKSLNRLISPLPDIYLQERIVLDWARQLYDIFEYLHSQQPPVIYRDLKPQNIIRDDKGTIHLVDFGIARTYKEGVAGDTSPMGSFLTASPEHYGGGQTDARSDIYTLGATFHYLLTNGKGRGTDLFDFAPPRNINPRISERTEKVIMKALHAEPEKRFSSVREMREMHISHKSPESAQSIPKLVDAPEMTKQSNQGRTMEKVTAGNEWKTRYNEGILQNIVNLISSQPAIIAILLTVIVLVGSTAVILKNRETRTATAVKSPKVRPSADPVAKISVTGSPEKSIEPTESPGVQTPGFNIVIGEQTPEIKPTPRTDMMIGVATPPAIDPAVPQAASMPLKHNTATPGESAVVPAPSPPAVTLKLQGTSEEMLATLFSVDKKEITLAPKQFDKFKYFTLFLPDNYYLIQFTETKVEKCDVRTAQFATIDDYKDIRSLRYIKIHMDNIGLISNDLKDIMDIRKNTVTVERNELLEENRSYLPYYICCKSPPNFLKRKVINESFIIKDYFLKIEKEHIAVGIDDKHKELKIQVIVKTAASEGAYADYEPTEFKPFIDSILESAQRVNI